jgi:prepilin-type N-terminal cleavage/methylation domain-containing protein
MKASFPKPRRGGFTIVELLITSAIIGVVGFVICMVLNSGAVLFAKNTAMNIAHEQARTAVLQIEQDLHGAISLPQLVDSSNNILTGVNAAGPAAGINFQVYGGGPYKVAADAVKTATAIKIYVPVQATSYAATPFDAPAPSGGTVSASKVPIAGQRLILPDHSIELDITSVTSSGGIVTLNFASALGVDVIKTNLNDATKPYNIMCFVTDKVSYIVQNGSLMYNGPTARKNSSVMATSIVTATPFSIPNTPAGALYYRFVAAINLSTADPEYSNRAFKSANMFLNSQVPMRARMCTYQ